MCVYFSRIHFIAILFHFYCFCLSLTGSHFFLSLAVKFRIVLDIKWHRVRENRRWAHKPVRVHRYDLWKNKYIKFFDDFWRFLLLLCVIFRNDQMDFRSSLVSCISRVNCQFSSANNARKRVQRNVELQNYTTLNCSGHKRKGSGNNTHNGKFSLKEKSRPIVSSVIIMIYRFLIHLETPLKTPSSHFGRKIYSVKWTKIHR